MSQEPEATDDVGYAVHRDRRGSRKGAAATAGPPRNRRREVPYDAVLGRMVTIREGGLERRVTAAEAFNLQLTKKGLEGCSASARALPLKYRGSPREPRPKRSGANNRSG